METYAILGDGIDDVSIRSACFSPEGKYIACAKTSGEVDIYSVASKEKRYVLRNPNKKSPFTMVKWREKGERSDDPSQTIFKTSNVLGTVNSDGQIQHWHMATGSPR